MLQEVFFFRPTRRTVDSCEHEGSSVVAHRDRGRDGVALNLNILQVESAVIPKNEDATVTAHGLVGRAKFASTVVVL